MKRSTSFKVEVFAVPGSPRENVIPCFPVNSLSTSAVCPAVNGRPCSSETRSRNQLTLEGDAVLWKEGRALIRSRFRASSSSISFVL